MIQYWDILFDVMQEERDDVASVDQHHPPLSELELAIQRYSQELLMPDPDVLRTFEKGLLKFIEKGFSLQEIPKFMQLFFSGTTLHSNKNKHDKIALILKKSYFKTESCESLLISLLNKKRIEETEFFNIESFSVRDAALMKLTLYYIVQQKPDYFVRHRQQIIREYGHFLHRYQGTNIRIDFLLAGPENIELYNRLLHAKKNEPIVNLAFLITIVQLDGRDSEISLGALNDMIKENYQLIKNTLGLVHRYFTRVDDTHQHLAPTHNVTDQQGSTRIQQDPALEQI